ncbi:hypothetical protein MTO96_041231 [Rhipicephalus appendiculatus]
MWPAQKDNANKRCEQLQRTDAPFGGTTQLNAYASKVPSLLVQQEHKESDYIIVLLCQRKCARPYVPEGLCLRKGVSSRLTNAGAFQCWERSPR